MATNNKTTLNLKLTTTNLKSKTFNVGYINPDSSDAELREFGQKIAALTTNTLNEVYRTNVEDITNASTDTSTAKLNLDSSSNFFSTDSATWKEFVRGLNISSSDTSVIKFNFTADETDNVDTYFEVKATEIASFGRNSQDIAADFFIEYCNARFVADDNKHHLFWTSLGNGKTQFYSDVGELDITISADENTKAAEILQSIWAGMTEEQKGTDDGTWQVSEDDNYQLIGEYNPV